MKWTKQENTTGFPHISVGENGNYYAIFRTKNNQYEVKCSGYTVGFRSTVADAEKLAESYDKQEATEAWGDPR